MWEGPNTESYRRYFQQAYEEQSSEEIEEKVQTYVRSWQRKYLALLKPQLNKVEKIRFSDLLSELTEEDRFTYSPKFTSWVGPEGSKTANELDEMSVNDLVRYLRDGYVPSRDFMGDSPEGLGRQLQTAVSTAPGHYADSAMMFSDLAINPTYHTGLLRGFREAVKENNRFSWAPVVELAGWLVRQDDTKAHRYTGQVDQDRNGFHESRLILPDLLCEGFVSEANPLPYKLADVVWDIIEQLMQDPDPSTASESKPYSDVMTVAINSVRSEALTAVIRFGLWVEKEEALESKLGPSSHMLRVWYLLDEHLDIKKDSSLAVRSVYGRWLPWIERLGSTWVDNNLTQLFPKPPEQKRWYEACWNTYLLFNVPYNSMFGILRSEYEYATNNLGAEIVSDGTTPEKRLAEHLLLYYVRALMNLNEPDSLIQLFYQNAALPLRQYSFDFLGRVLRNDGDFQEVFIERLMQLVDYRLAKASNYDEFEQIGWWIESRALPNEWKLTTLQKVLPKLEKIDPLHRVLFTLVQLVEQDPEGVLQCFEAIAGMPSIDQRTHMLQKPTKEVLIKLVKSTDDDIRDRSVKLAHEFGSKGLWNLRDLTIDA